MTQVLFLWSLVTRWFHSSAAAATRPLTPSALMPPLLHPRRRSFRPRERKEELGDNRELPENRLLLPARFQTPPSSEPPELLSLRRRSGGRRKRPSFMEADSLLGGTVNEVYGSWSGSESAEEPLSRRVSDTGESHWVFLHR